MVFSKRRRRIRRTTRGGKRRRSKTKRRRKSRSRRSRKSRRRRRKGGQIPLEQCRNDLCRMKARKRTAAAAKAKHDAMWARERASDQARLAKSRARSIAKGHAQRVKGSEANGFGCKDKYDGANKGCGKWYYYHPDGNSYFCRNPASGDQCSDVSGIWGARKRKF